jgi:hypothetical protein
VDRQARQLYRETLSGLAGDTGGFLIQGTNDLAAGLRRMIEDNDSYYLMAYEPSNPKRDGRFRKIAVRLPRHRNLTVRTRKGYLAPDDRKLAAKPGSSVAARSAGAAAAAPDALDEGEARAALATPMRANDIPVRLAADYVQIPPAGPQAIIRAHVDLSQLRWEEAAGRRRASVELAAGVYDAEGKLVGAPSGKVAELDLGPAEYPRAAAAGLHISSRWRCPPAGTRSGSSPARGGSCKRGRRGVGRDSGPHAEEAHGQRPLSLLVRSRRRRARGQRGPAA